MEYFGDKVSHVKEIIIVHSKSDKIIPINSARIAHQNISHSELIELDNLGHYRILWSDELKEIITNRIA
jgi:pimeloyl-ACP methyl ester carboxylesterase